MTSAKDAARKWAETPLTDGSTDGFINSLAALLTTWGDARYADGQAERVASIMHNPDMDGDSLAAMLRRDGYERGQAASRAEVMAMREALAGAGSDLAVIMAKIVAGYADAAIVGSGPFDASHVLRAAQHLASEHRAARAALAATPSPGAGAAVTVPAESALEAFGRWCLTTMREPAPGDIDGGDAQDKALELGLLIEFEATESCGDECTCAEYFGEFPAKCLRLAGTEATPKEVE